MADIDHRFMTPPSLRIQQSSGVAAPAYVWDLRVASPNVSHLPMPVVHSLEHLLAVALREASDRVLAVAPMGCQTGFYIMTAGIDDFATIERLVAGALESVALATEVPLANDVACGWAENHSLVGAQRVAAWLLRHRASWAAATSEPGAG